MIDTEKDVRAVAIITAMRCTTEIIKTVTENFNGISDYDIPNPYELADDIADYIQNGNKGEMPGKIERRYQ